MAPPKRKRKPTRTTTNKRPKYTVPDTDSSSSTEDEATHDSQEEWEAVRILDQRGQGFALQYYIEWKDIDPATGKPWAPTWEKASNASATLRASWKAELARRAQEKKEADAAARRSTQQRSARDESPAQTTQSRGVRSRIVENPEPLESATALESPPHTKQGAAAIASSQTVDIEPPIPDWTSPQVNIDLRGDSFNRREYEPFSEIPESQSSPEKSAAEGTTLESSQLFASQPTFLASGIVRDTQSSAGDVSYIPVTQEELESSLHSDSSDESKEDHVIGYSVSQCCACDEEPCLLISKGLLDTSEAPKLGACPHSPATSIAETIAGTTQDFHSQRQLESQQEQSGISGTLESQSPANSGKLDRTGTHHDSGSSHQIEADLKQPHDSAESPQTESPLLFIENTTQLDHDTPVAEPEQRLQEQNEFESTTQEVPGPASNTQLSARVEESEVLAVADTPHISKLSSTIRGNTTQEAQPGSAHRFDYVHLGAEYEKEVSQTECSVWEENAQFPFFSQRPAYFDPRSAASPTQRALTEPPRIRDTHVSPNTRLSEGPRSSFQQEGGTLGKSGESTTIDEVSQEQEELDTLLDEILNPRLSHTLGYHRDLQSVASGSKQYTLDEARAAAVSQQPPPSSEESSGSREQNAQLVPSSTYSDTQEEAIGRVRETVEIDIADASRSKHSIPCSRHDSSQETPERYLGSGERSSSPIPHPPSYSLRALDSNIPPRPVSPVLTSSLSKMAESTAEKPSEQAARRLAEIMGTDRRERRRSRASQSSVAATTSAAVNDAASQSNNALVLPSINISAEGTRSPSTVPDRSPAPPANAPLGTVPAASSLRSVAFANKVTEPLMIESLLPKPKTVDKPPAEKTDDLATAVIAAAARSVPAAPSSPMVHDGVENLNEVDATHEIDDMDDYEDDDEDPYDDELKLDDEEYIVPLYIEGRQRDTYTEYIKQKEELLNEVLVHGPAPIEKLDEVERALTYLKAVETHPDLTYAEAESATGSELNSLADVQHGAQFGIDNSVKFKFLGQLLNSSRDKMMHVVILLDQDNDALFNILKTFLVAGHYNFRLPTKPSQSTASPDSLSITVFPKSMTPVLPAVNLIICLDGVQNAAQARQKKAPAAGKIIPVLHLVIPQTVGHLERYMLPTTDRRTRIETILAGLARAQAGNEVGNAIDIDTPSAGEAAQMITSWLFPDEGQESTEWPLPSIGSAKSLIEWDATQQSVRSAASSPAPERTKRPLVSER